MVPVGQRKLYFRLLEHKCQTWHPVLKSANKPETNFPRLSVHSKSVFGMEFNGAPMRAICFATESEGSSVSCVGSATVMEFVEACAADCC